MLVDADDAIEAVDFFGGLDAGLELLAWDELAPVLPPFAGNRVKMDSLVPVRVKVVACLPCKPK